MWRSTKDCRWRCSRWKWGRPSWRCVSSGSIGRINQGHLRTGKLTDDEWPRLTEAIEKLRNISLHIDETPGLTPSELRANARRLARQCGKLGLIVVDYLQLMSGSRRRRAVTTAPPSWARSRGA